MENQRKNGYLIACKKKMFDSITISSIKKIDAIIYERKEWKKL